MPDVNVPHDVDPMDLRKFVGNLLVVSGMDAKLSEDGSFIRMDKIVNCRLSRTTVDYSSFKELDPDGLDDLAGKMNENREKETAKVYVLIFPGELSDQVKDGLLAADIRPWDMPYLAERFGAQFEKVDSPFTEIAKQYL